MNGFHEHVSRSRLFQPALNVLFCEKQVTLLDVRESVTQGESATKHNILASKDAESVKTSAVMNLKNNPQSAPAAPVRGVMSSIGTSMKGDLPSAPSASESVVIPSGADDGKCDLPPAPSVSLVSGSNLRNLAVKIEKTKSHRDFLSTCNREHLIPKGFQLRWVNHYADEKKTTRILQGASKELVKTCQNLASEKLSVLTERFRRGWQELSSSVSKEVLNSLSAKISRDRVNVRKRLQRNKLGKLHILRNTSMRGALSFEESVPVDGEFDHVRSWGQTERTGCQSVNRAVPIRGRVRP